MSSSWSSQNECPNVRRCGLNGCNSDAHSRYLHDDVQETHNDDGSSQPKVGQRPNDEHPDGTGNRDQTGNGHRSHASRQADRVSLMVLPAMLRNGNKSLKVNVMQDNCFLCVRGGSRGAYARRKKATTNYLRNRRFGSEEEFTAGRGGGS